MVSVGLIFDGEKIFRLLARRVIPEATVFREFGVFGKKKGGKKHRWGNIFFMRFFSRAEMYFSNKMTMNLNM